MKKMFNALSPQGVLVTYCAKGKVKRALKSVGFKIEPLPGPPFKREITRALKSNFSQNLWHIFVFYLNINVWNIGLFFLKIIINQSIMS